MEYTEQQLRFIQEKRPELKLEPVLTLDYVDEKTRGYTCVSAIQTAFSILQSGVIDRENKLELKKLREAMERLEGEPQAIEI